MRSALACIWLIGFASVAFLACGSDDDDNAAAGGSGGSAAKGGTGTGGATGATGGSSATGATAGEGESGSPGTGASAGTGGSTETGGSSNGSGGKGGTNAAGGTKSSGGTGGTTAQGGSGNEGGTTGGESGAAGESAGNGQGGTAGSGTAGSSALAGNGGTAGGGGFAGTSGSAGGGGFAGSGTAGSGTTSALLCHYPCTQGGSECGTAEDVDCGPHGECEQTSTGCDTNDDCIPFASGWSDTGARTGESCGSDDDCSGHVIFGDVCVDTGETQGRCAVIPDPEAGCFFPGSNTVSMNEFDGSGPVDVCESLAGRCDDHQCVLGCASDADCTDGGTVGPGFGPHCDTASRRCGGCGSDQDCFTAGSGPSHCDVQSQTCECASDADCTARGADHCYAGTCGCSDASACGFFPNSPATCN
ncbi:MAG TPA: hypothetical protein VMI54_07000 [Polyangiaceae bacterium]|nr:hypothetical protein [Polyangiaceae bacterium]